MKQYSALDGSSPSAEILSFQKWANSKGEKVVDEDGLWSAKTSALYPSVKTRYERETGEQIGKLKPNYTASKVVLDEKGNIKSLESNSAKDIVAIPLADTNKKIPKKGFSSWSTTKKTIVIGSSLAVLGLAVWYFAIRKK